LQGGAGIESGERVTKNGHRPVEPEPDNAGGGKKR